MISKIELIKKNWDGENRWRRVELNEMANEYSLNIDKEYSNKQVFDIILEYIDQEELYQDILSKDEYLSQLYLKFMKQLPSKECMTKNYQGVKEMYSNFIKHNKNYFFKQNKNSCIFLSFVLENSIYQTNDNWKSLESKHMFFDGKGNYTFMI
jgi:hypothetical protein